MRLIAPFLALAVLAACGPKGSSLVSDSPQGKAYPEALAAVARAARPAPMIADVPAGTYRTDPEHSSLIFSISHMGFSNLTGQFSKFSADLTIDPKNPGGATVSAVIDPNSLDYVNDPPGFEDYLKGPDWLNVKAHPRWTFKSTRVTLTGPNTADVAGDFTMLGVTKPVTLKATFNGGYRGMQYDPQARIGFSLRGQLKRSEFGLEASILDPATHMGASDEITFVIETEMKGPPLPGAPAPVPPPNH